MIKSDISKKLSMTEKIQIKLVSAGDCGSFQNSFMSSKKQSVSKLVDVIRKKLSLNQSQSIFLFYKEFAIYPDMTVGDIADYTPGTSSIDIYYSLSQPFG